MHLPRVYIVSTLAPFRYLILLGFFGFVLTFVACNDQLEHAKSNENQKIEIVTYQDFSEKTRTIFSNYFDSISGYDQFSGVALIYQNDSLWKFKAGKPRFAENDTFKYDDVFQLASVSKPITAFGLLRLFEAKNLAINAPVKSFLPRFSDDRITVYQLLTHTSGLGNYIYSTDSLWANPDSFLNNSEVGRYFEEGLIPPYNAPGQRFDYCNSNYVILANIITEVSGVSFSDYMKNEVFEPLNMTLTHYQSADTNSCLGYRVYGHYPNGDYKRPFYLNGVVGDKGLYSSVEDLLRFYMQVKRPTLVSDSMMQVAISPLEKVDQQNFYGLGWRVKQINQDSVVFHNGWWRGFRTYFWFDKRSDKAIIILTNSIAGGYLNQTQIWGLIH